uniref:Uncharacterized protein n=1 Tax=Marmota marmota marmota TaxID=9994 RepID=A0A8C6EPS6_MARMA
MRGLCLPLPLSLLCSRHARGSPSAGELGGQSWAAASYRGSSSRLEGGGAEDAQARRLLSPSPKGHEVEYSGCAPSCEAVSHNFQRQTLGTHPEIAMEGLGQQTPPRLELGDVSCCLQDLCNRPGLQRPFMVGRAPGPPAGGLLLILAPALLWALFPRRTPLSSPQRVCQCPR